MGTANKQRRRHIASFDGIEAVHSTECDHGADWTETSLSADEADPAAETEGLDCSNAQRLAVMTHTIATLTNYDIVIWVNGGSTASKWAILRDHDGNQVAWRGRGAIAQAFNDIDVRGFDRVYAQIDNGTWGGGSMVKAVKVY